MRSSKTVHVISAHAEGEVGDVIVGGVLPPPGETLWAQSRWIAQDQTLRNFVLNEPRGGVFRHVNLLVPPKHPEADAAFIYKSDTLGREKLRVLPLPAGISPKVQYQIARLTLSKDPAQSDAFIDYLLGPKAQARLTEAGFRGIG